MGKNKAKNKQIWLEHPLMKPFTTATLLYYSSDVMLVRTAWFFFHQIYYVLQEVSIIMRNQVSNSE